MNATQIAVIGAGAAGLSTAGALKRLGLHATVLDREAWIGASWRRRYDRLHLHTVRRFSGLSHYPMPREYPRYVSREQYARYLELYRERFDIDVVHDCEVRSIQADDRGARDERRFLIETTAGDWRARAVVIATGMYCVPVIPDLPDIERYSGVLIHSSLYAKGGQFTGKRVLVVGLGNTGAEIAADLVESGAKSVAVSIRTMPPIVPRDFLATPVQLFGIALSRVPARLADGIGAFLSRIALGDLRRHGLQHPGWLPFSARRIPVIDVGFVDALKRGKIAVRPAVTSFTNDGVVFSDGRSEPFDAIILATGYRTGLESILKIPGLLDETGYPKFASGTRTSEPRLYFMGFFESHRGLLFETEIASRRLARIIAEDLAVAAHAS